jgi:hypothetical protein
MRAILLADNLGRRFQGYMGAIILRVYFELRSSPNLEPYAEVVALKLKHAAKYDDNQEKYLLALSDILSRNASEFRIKFDHDHFDELSRTLFGYVVA